MKNKIPSYITNSINMHQTVSTYTTRGTRKTRQTCQEHSYKAIDRSNRHKQANMKQKSRSSGC